MWAGKFSPCSEVALHVSESSWRLQTTTSLWHLLFLFLCIFYYSCIYILFKKQLDNVLMHKVWFTGLSCAGPGLGLSEPCGLLTTQDILWYYHSHNFWGLSGIEKMSVFIKSWILSVDPVHVVSPSESPLAVFYTLGQMLKHRFHSLFVTGNTCSGRFFTLTEPRTFIQNSSRLWVNC